MAGWRRQAARTRILVGWTALAALAGLAACEPAVGLAGSSTPPNDLVGAGGQIDQTYREIYTPGSGTNF